MSLSRRRFVQTVGAGAAGLGSPAAAAKPVSSTWASKRARAGDRPRPIILSSNENPLGPGKAVLDAVRGGVRRARPLSVRHEPPRSPSSSPRSTASSRRTCCSARARRRSCARTTHIFCSKTAPLVAPIPAYEECAGYAALMGYPVRTVKLTPPPELKMDVAALLDAVEGRRHGVLLQPEQPGRHRRRRQDDARLHRRARQELARTRRRWWTRRTSNTPRCPATRR